MAVRVTQAAAEVQRTYDGSAEAETRVTQAAVEITRAGTISQVRVTQAAVEVIRVQTLDLSASDTLAGALTEAATLLADPTAGIRLTQEVLEPAKHPLNDIHFTQEVLEPAKHPSDNLIHFTQEDLEIGKHPGDNLIHFTAQRMEVPRHRVAADANEIWCTQFAMEVVIAFPDGQPPDVVWDDEPPEPPIEQEIPGGECPRPIFIGTLALQSDDEPSEDVDADLEADDEPRERRGT
jgi:hypothetical protein